MFQSDLFHAAVPAPSCDMAGLVRAIADHSARPRYTFMVLDMIARVARPDGQAGPLVRVGDRLVPIRQWLASAIAPSSARHPQRRAMADRLRSDLIARGHLPPDAKEAERIVAAALDDHVSQVGMTAVSRAVSELVRAGLLRRHYQGYAVDHDNRGAQRQAVYTITPAARRALGVNGHRSFPRYGRLKIPGWRFAFPGDQP